MHTSLSDCVKEIEAKTEGLNKMLEEHQRALKKGREWLNELERQKALLLSSLDIDKINLGEHVLSVQMHEAIQGDDPECIDETISELANNAGERLFAARNSTKDYDRWSHQGCGWMGYFCGPRHGSVVFSIGISRPLRENPRPLTKDEIDAAIYLLEMLKATKWFPLEFSQIMKRKINQRENSHA